MTTPEMKPFPNGGTMSFKGFEVRCHASGLKAIDCGNGHWRIVGGKREVNWYPTSKKRTVYVNGESGRITFSGTEGLAIEAAIGNIGKEKQQRIEGGLKVKIKKKLLKADPRCFKCRCQLDRKTATLDHRIPLAKGGTNAESNLQLACEKCNVSKADSFEVTP